MTEEVLLDLVHDFDEDIEEEMRVAISNGDNPNQRNSKGYTLLMLAAMSSHEIPARVLLESGADMNTTLDESLCSLSQIDLTPFLMSVESGVLNTVKLMLEHGADIDSVNGAGFTALHFAAEEGMDDKLKLLLGWTSNLEHKNNNGMTPALMAAWNGHFSTLKILIDAGAKLDAITNSNEDIMELAQTDEIKYYLEPLMPAIRRKKKRSAPMTKDETLLFSNRLRNPLWRSWYRCLKYLLRR